MPGTIDNNHILSVHHLGSHRCLYPLLLLFKVIQIEHLSDEKHCERYQEMREAPIKIQLQPTSVSLIC